MEELIIDKSEFTPLTAEEKEVEAVVRPSIGYWKDAWQRLLRDKMAIASLDRKSVV